VGARGEKKIDDEHANEIKEKSNFRFSINKDGMANNTATSRACQLKPWDR
jgi:hypothetical protein